MPEEEFNKIIESHWKILPEDVRTLVLSTEFESKMNWVAGKYNLSPDQIESLKQETLFVLIGLTHIMDYTDNIMRELAVQKEQARVIAQEIGIQIFSEVKESLKELGWLIEMRKEAEESTQTPESAPTIIQKKEDFIPNTPVAGVLIEQTEKEDKTTPKEDKNINKAVLLEEIEHPALISAHSGTVVDQKLSGIVKIPREEVKVNVSNIAPEKKYQGIDPYREPIE